MTLTEKTLTVSLMWMIVKAVGIASLLVFACYTFANHEVRIKVEITEKPSIKTEGK